jgi:hypothetical protein
MTDDSASDLAWCFEAADEIERLRSEVAAQREDAERYRWLRQANDGWHWQVSKRSRDGMMIQIGDPDNRYLDAAIDAARRK